MLYHFTFNAFSENTYILSDETKECVIFDPGCYTEAERNKLADFITHKGLKPVRLINTHCHLDHVFGNPFVAERYGLGLEVHKGELEMLRMAPQIGEQWGVLTPVQPEPSRFIEDEEIIAFGKTELKAILAPGHSPASLCFYCEAQGFLIGGDVLFYESIGRTDLPGGSRETLLRSIETRLMVLPDETKVYSGHGGATTIGHERRYNPFLG